MNKAELISKLAEKTSLTKADVEKVVNAFTETVIEGLQNNDGLSLVGFGSFSAVERKARTGRNPQTGKEIKIAARKSPKFTPGKAFKDALATSKKK